MERSLPPFVHCTVSASRELHQCAKPPEVTVNIVKKLKVCGFVSMFSVIVTLQVLGQGISDEQQIRELRAESNAYISRHDALGVASLLDSEYQITTGNGQLFQVSPEEEAGTWKQIFETSEDIVYIRTPTTIEVSMHLPRAAEFGSWVGTWTTPAGPKEVGGRYAAHWRKVDGQWKIRAELFVTMYCNGAEC